MPLFHHRQVPHADLVEHAVDARQRCELAHQERRQVYEGPVVFGETGLACGRLGGDLVSVGGW